MPKRRASRVEMSRSVEFHGPYGTSQGTVQDFSPRGCRIHRVDAKVHCGMRLTLRFSLPDRLEPTEIKHAVVTWTRKNDFGVEFSNQSRETLDRKSTRLNSSHQKISYAVFCLKKKKKH